MRRTDREDSAEATPSTVSAYFHEQAVWWDELYRGEDVYSVVHQLRRLIALHWIDALGLPPGTRVLEAGCGAGLVSVALAQRGFEVHATDAVPAMLERARNNAQAAGVADRVSFAIADVQALDLPDEGVDLVVALGVVPWLASPAAALAEMARVTRPHGSVVVNADNSARLHLLLDPRLNPRLAPARAAIKAKLWPRGLDPDAASQSRAPRVKMHSLGEFDAMLDAVGFDKVRGQTLGYGPFTVLGRSAVPRRLGVRLHGWLQGRADDGVSALAERGAQYLVLGRRRPADRTPAGP